MAWTNAHRRISHGIILGLLLLAFVGPWAFELIDVPAEYACSAPFVRLQGDFCGTPLPGLWILLALAGELGNTAVALASGSTALVEPGRLLLFLLGVFLLVLPVFSTLRMLLPGERRRPRFAQPVVWGLAGAASVWWLCLTPAEWLPGRLWGPWFYAGIAACMLILEAVFAISRGRG